MLWNFMNKIRNSIYWSHLDNPWDKVLFVVSNENNSQYPTNIHEFSFVDVDYELTQNEIQNNWFFGKEWYTIASNFDSANKMSKWYLDCVWIVFVWTNEIGENISSLAHVPINLLNGFYWWLSTDKEWKKITKSIIDDILQDFLLKTKKGTRDVMFFGWNLEWSLDSPWLDEEYEYSVKYLSNIIQNRIGFKPVVIWPNDFNFDTDVYFVNDERVLYIDKPLQRNRTPELSPTNRPYTSNKIKEVKELRHSKNSKLDFKKKLFDTLS